MGVTFPLIVLRALIGTRCVIGFLVQGCMVVYVINDTYMYHRILELKQNFEYSSTQ